MQKQLQPNTNEWLEMRRKYIGGSDAPIIMMVSPWRTPYDLWRDKLNLSKGQISTASMQMGLAIEPEAREVFEERTGHVVFAHTVYHPEHKFIMANLDGMTLETNKNNRVAVEIKCAGKEDHECALSGKIPVKYMPQLQHQMFAAELDSIYYLSFNKVCHKLLKVERNQSYIDEMFAKECEFWQKVQSKEQPDLCDRDYEVRTDSYFNEIEEQWKQVTSQIEEMNQMHLKPLQDIQKSLRETLITLSNGHNSVGSVVKLTKCLKKGNVNLKLVPELKGVDLEPYREDSTEYWRVTNVRGT